MKNRNQVIIISGSNFPESKSAGTQKLKLMVSAMVEAGIDVKVYMPLVLSETTQPDHGLYKKSFYKKFNWARPKDAKIKKGICLFVGYFSMLYRIINDAKTSKKPIIMLSYTQFPYYFLSYCAAKLLSMKVVVSIMEHHPSCVKSKLASLNARLFDHWFINVCDGLLPITKALEKRVLSNWSFVSRSMVIPALADFNLIYSNGLADNPITNYFVLCSSVGYKENIDFCKMCLNKMQNTEATLQIVIYGKDDLIRKTINDNKDERVSFLTDLSNEELYLLYASAIGLLMPMRSANHQDLYRFPQKIAEYLVSQRPIITNNVGIVKDIFIDNHDAIVVEGYDVNLFSTKMDSLFCNKELASRIGHNGYLTGKEMLHYQNFSKPLVDFFDSIYCKD